MFLQLCLLQDLVILEIRLLSILYLCVIDVYMNRVARAWVRIGQVPFLY